MLTEQQRFKRLIRNLRIKKEREKTMEFSEKLEEAWACTVCDHIYAYKDEADTCCQEEKERQWLAEEEERKNFIQPNGI